MRFPGEPNMKIYQPGDKFAVDVELVRRVNHGERVTLQTGEIVEVFNLRQDKWWARTIPGNDQSLVLVCLDPIPLPPQSTHEFKDTAEKLINAAFQVRNQLTDMAQAMDDARDQYLALLRKYNLTDTPQIK